ncbi:MAG TPA: OmpH family outer membrane protein [Chitinophagaceae bacterium]|nr:OmpH family outer membrane protein [Chitinophagaceae bacterium]
MKKVIKLVIIFVALVVFTSSTLNAQTKFGYVSVDEILSIMPEIKKVQNDLASFDSSLQINYAETIKEYLSKDSAFRKDSAKFSPAVRQAKQADLDKLSNDLQNFQQNYQNLVTEKRNQLMQPVIEKAVNAIREVAKANGYAYVLSKEALISYPEADDLAPLVKKKLGIVEATKPNTNKPSGN